MPTLISKKRKKGTQWYIVENKKENGKLEREYLVSLGYITKTEAKLELAKYLTLNKNRGKGDITLKQAHADFNKYYITQVGQSIKQGTYDIFIAYTAKTLNMLGKIELGEMEYHHVEKLKQSLKNDYNLSNRTINMHLTELNRILKYAVKRNWIESYPRLEHLPLNNSDREVEHLTRKEIEILLKKANREQSIYIHLMVYTGMRPNEASKLQWDDVSLKENYIDIISDNRKKAGRRIPIHPKLKKVLESIEFKTGTVCPFAISRYARRSMKRLENKTGIVCNPYKFRKTFGSLLAQAGEDSINIAKLMGHSKVQTTFQYYLRLTPENLKKSINKL